MAKHLNPLEKEFLIRKFKGNSKVKLGDFCRANNVSETSFKKWLKCSSSPKWTRKSQKKKGAP